MYSRFLPTTALSDDQFASICADKNHVELLIEAANIDISIKHLEESYEVCAVQPDSPLDHQLQQKIKDEKAIRKRLDKYMEDKRKSEAKAEIDAHKMVHDELCKRLNELDSAENKTPELQFLIDSGRNLAATFTADHYSPEKMNVLNGALAILNNNTPQNIANFAATIERNTQGNKRSITGVAAGAVCAFLGAACVALGVVAMVTLGLFPLGALIAAVGIGFAVFGVAVARKSWRRTGDELVLHNFMDAVKPASAKLGLFAKPQTPSTEEPAPKSASLSPRGTE